MRVVLDSNVVVAGFAARGICSALFEYCIENHEVVVCAEILAETERALLRKVRVPRGVVRDVVAYLGSEAEVVVPAEVEPGACRDQSDLAVLGAAVAGQCKYVITGDADLLVLGAYAKVEIVSPRAFWERVKRGKGAK
jgi:putative PIN family toxin of toxin-antitoxin system